MLDPEFARSLADGFRRVVGRPLVPPGERAAEWLYHDAPFGLLAHDAGADPLFTYANTVAQRCFEYSWDEFVGLRSRLSAEADRQEDRERLLAAVREHGFVEGHRGLRIAKSGRRFWIEEVLMWNLVDEHGRRTGQAALFPKWTYLAQP